MVFGASHSEPVEFVFVDELSPDEFGDYLFLEPHELFPRQWAVAADDANWLPKFEGVLGPEQSISILTLPKLYETARDQGYGLAFFEDPQPVFDWLASLDRAPQVTIKSDFEGTVNGFLPFQVQAHNFALACERMVFLEHSTGTGKTVSAEGLILAKDFDVCLYVVKPRYLRDAYGKLEEQTDVAKDAIIIRGSPARRKKLYQSDHSIFIMNAEKFREDTDEIIELIADKNLLIIVDEIPTKYSHRNSALYRATAKALYSSFSTPKRGKLAGKPIFYPRSGYERASSMFMVQMSAFPIISSPEGFFNCVRMGDSSIFGSVDQFGKTFVKRYDRWGEPVAWKNLDLMGAMTAHIVHHVDKRDPEIAAQFPEKLPPETVYVDLDPVSEKLYSLLQSQYDFKKIQQGLSILSFQELLAAIHVFQLICSNPRAVLRSAKQFEEFVAGGIALEDTGASDKELAEYAKRMRKGSEVAWKFRQHVNDDSLFTDRDKKGNCTISKMLALREKLEAHGDKAIVFTQFNDLMLPYIGEWFEKWGLPYVAYHGELSQKAGDEALDRFRFDPDIQILLSSDAGQDSINLPQASMTNHYDPPADTSYAGLEQRDNRMHRIDSVKESVRSIRYITPSTVESRKLEIMETKRGYHDQVFGGKIAEQAAGFGKKDLIYMLTGERDE